MNRTALILTLALVVPACGGDTEAPAADQAQAPDPSIQPVEREALTEADFAGLNEEEIAVEIPWTANAINRTPAEAAARALIEAVEVQSHEGFDRVIFTVSDLTAFPGYRAELLPAGSSVACGEPAHDEGGADEGEQVEGSGDESGGEDHDSGFVPEVDGVSYLAVKFRPARNHEDGRTTVSVGTETFDEARVHDAGLVCAENDVVMWVAGLKEGSDVRVLEMRRPNRLVVDVR